MQLISTFNQGFGFWLCVNDTYSKYAWVIPMKDKKGTPITNAFQKISKESDRKPNKKWTNKGSEFYKKSFKSWSEKNTSKMYSAHNEEKSVFAETFIRTLKNKIYRYLISISKNMYIDKLDDRGYKYNNTY